MARSIGFDTVGFAERLSPTNGRMDRTRIPSSFVAVTRIIVLIVTTGTPPANVSSRWEANVPNDRRLQALNRGPDDLFTEVVLVKRSERSSMFNVSCPVCRLPMHGRQYEGRLICHCSNCHGHWLRKPQLKHVIETRIVSFDMTVAVALARTTPSRDVPINEFGRMLSCPDCNLDLDSRKYADDSPITVNRCVECEGVWLDRDELELIQMLIEAFDDLLDL